MYTKDDDWDGDQHTLNGDVHFRLYLSPHANVPTVICVQDFDYFEYDARRILSPKAWITDGEAVDALLSLMPEINRVHQELSSSTVDYALRPFMFAQMIRKYDSEQRTTQ